MKIKYQQKLNSTVFASGTWLDFENFCFLTLFLFTAYSFNILSLFWLHIRLNLAWQLVHNKHWGVQWKFIQTPLGLLLPAMYLLKLSSLFRVDVPLFDFRDYLTKRYLAASWWWFKKKRYWFLPFVMTFPNPHILAQVFILLKAQNS